jgi:hypothetical protein
MHEQFLPMTSSALPSSSILSRPGWWSLLAVLLTMVPLALPSVPPLTDLPAHMARIMVQLDAGRSADIARWYSFAWDIIPNLGTDLLAQFLVPVLGLEAAMKAIVLLIVGLQAAGYLLLSREAHGRVTVSAVFALPLVYSAPLQHGFLNFSLATALATLSLALWISPRMTVRPLLRYGLFVPIGCAIWISHLAGWAILCVMVGCCEVTARWNGWRHVPATLTRGFASASCLLVPGIAASMHSDASERLPTHGFFHFDEKVYFLVNVLADRWDVFDTLSAVLLFAAVIVASVSRAFAIHRGLALAAGALFALFWLLPTSVFGTYYTDMRVIPSALALALIAARPRLSSRQARLLAMAGAAFFLLRLAGTTVSMFLWDRQIKQDLSVLEGLPPGAQLVSFSALPCRTFVLQERVRDIHLASFALIRKRAFANDQFSMPGGQLMTIHNPAAGPFDRDPSSIEIGEPCQGSIPVLKSAAMIPRTVPYLWIIWHAPRLPVPDWEPIADAGGSVLYQRRR